MRNGAHYAVFVNTGQEFDGSDSVRSPSRGRTGRREGTVLRAHFLSRSAAADPCFARRGPSRTRPSRGARCASTRRPSRCTRRRRLSCRCWSRRRLRASSDTSPSSSSGAACPRGARADPRATQRAQWGGLCWVWSGAMVGDKRESETRREDFVFCKNKNKIIK
eukprot:3137853-Prymnesium_polylepis.1